MSTQKTEQIVRINDGDVRFPVVLRGLCVILSLVVGLSAIAGIVFAFNEGRELLVGFEACVLLACVFCVLTGFGKFGAAPAMAMFIAGGAVLVGAVLGDPAFSGVLEGAPIKRSTEGVDLMMIIFARLGASGVFFALAALTVLVQRPSTSFVLLIKGAILALPLAGVATVVVVPSIRNTVFGLSGILLAAVAMIGMVVVIGFLAASGHFLIRAFESGMPENRNDAG